MRCDYIAEKKFRESQRLAADGGMEREKVRDWQLMEGWRERKSETGS